MGRVVAVGSLNSTKINAVAKAYSMFGITVDVRPVKVQTPTQQPLGLSEITNGAVVRARLALEAVNKAEEAIGIETGLVKVGDLTYLNIPVAAIMSRDGYLTIGIGPGFAIPTSLIRNVELGMELEKAVEMQYGYANAGESMGLVGILTRGLVTRLDANTWSVLMALIPRLPWNRGLYGG